MRAVILLCLLEAASIQAGDYAWHPEGTDLDIIGNASPCKTDEGACGCCLMLQGTERLRTHVNRSLNELEDIYSQTSKTLDQMKNVRAAFSVALFSAAGFKCRGPFTVDTVVVYQHTFLNVGGGYDGSTGVFTVPHSGVYSIALTVYSDAGSSVSALRICTTLRVNGNAVAKSSDHNIGDQEDSSTVVMAIHLKKGDTLDVLLLSRCFICDEGHYNTFSAFLLYRD